MKFYSFLAAACGLACSFNAAAQQDLSGSWLGTLDAGTVKLRVVFNLSTKDGVLKATMDSPDQGVKDIPVSEVRQSGDSINLATGPVVYHGRIVNDSTIDGVLVQGRAFPIVLKRTAEIARKRPQTPRPPFPYASEDFVFSNEDKSVTLGATLTAPKDGQKHPAVLLITGSGQQNRDEEIMEHKPFAVIADYLSRRGFVVLRVDDRGMGKSKGDLSHATSLDFAHDAATALDFLKKRPEVDPKKLGLLGHSEGGMIATMLAAERKDIAFIISMAGPGVNNLQLLKDQNDALLEKAGLSAEARKAYLELYTDILRSGMQKEQPADIKSAVSKAISDWRKKTPADIVLQTTHISDEASADKVASAFADQLSVPWFRYFIAYDPGPSIRKLSCKVLVLNGKRDIQVVSGSNTSGWQAALKKSHAKSYKVLELPGLNHLFQTCTRCDIDEYGELEQTIAPEALGVLGDWLDREIK